MRAHFLQHLSLHELQRIRDWQVEHRAEHPLEYHVWDCVLALWVMGYVGWLPAVALDLPEVYPLCLAAMLAPDWYAAFRSNAHRLRRLRCDWLGD